MKIHVSGFELKLHKQLSFTEFEARLNKKNNKRATFKGLERVLNVQKKGNFILGLFSTDRGIRTYTSLEKTTNKQSVSKTDPNKPLSDFIFFILSETSSRGLMTRYKGSGGLPFLASYFEHIADRVLLSKKDSEMSTSPTKKSMILKKYSGKSIEWNEIYNKQQAELVLKKWEKIKSMEFRFAHPDDNLKGIPIKKQLVRLKTEILSFENDASRKSKWAYVKELLGLRAKVSPDTIRVSGKNEEGADTVIDVDNIPDWFGETPYEKALGDPNIFDNDLTKSELIKMLLKEAKDKPRLF